MDFEFLTDKLPDDFTKAVKVSPLDKIGEKATSISLEKNCYIRRKDYYFNIRKIGLEYEDLDYSKCLDFLLMTVKNVC